MALNNKCPGLIYNTSYDNSDKEPLRVAVLAGCRLTEVKVFNIIIKAIERPITLTYHQNYGKEDNGQWNGIIGELINNRSDFSANIAEVLYNRYQNIQYSPSFFFGNAITILTGKILANNGNEFMLLSSFSLKLWLTLCAMLIVISICNSILHKEYSKWTFHLVGVVGHFMKLWVVFINQSIQFGNICCVKHLIVNSVTVISIFLMTLFFTSEILSNIIIQPLIKIDTMDDLVKYTKQNPNVKLFSDNLTSSWKVMTQWDDERAKFVLPRITSLPYHEFDYNQVYHGKSIMILYDSIFERMLNFNQDLTFYMSSDRLFAFQYSLLYSKYIDNKTKIFIDSIISSLFESGIYNYIMITKSGKHLDLVEDEPPLTISISYFKRIMIIYIYSVILLILILFIEFLLYSRRNIIFTIILHCLIHS